MECGSITDTDFHSGLSGRVGDPHLDFAKAMEAEQYRGQQHAVHNKELWYNDVRA
jgi:hypothetical protein